MKAKIEIQDGSVKIVLTAENEFEKTMIDDAKKRDDLEKTVSFKSDYNYGIYQNQRIELSFIKKGKEL